MSLPLSGSSDLKKGEILMNILLVEPAYQAKFRPLGLMRISSYHKARGDDVRFVKGNKKLSGFAPGKIYITTLFTYQYPVVKKCVLFYSKAYPRADIRVGGILASLHPERFKLPNVKVHKGLWNEVEKYPPDYSLFPEMDYSLTFLSRGCINRCKFCCVWRTEPKFYSTDWIKDIDPSKRRIIIMDNNWLAKPWEELVADVQELKRMKKEYGVNNIDFNQSLDCRLFQRKHAELLYGLPIRPMRFSFDGMHQDVFIQNAIRWAKEFHFAKIRVDVLFNFMDTPEDFYYRLKELCNLQVAAIPMRYAPLENYDRDYVGKHWTKKMLQGFGRLRRAFVFPRDVKEFEYYLGKDGKEFKRLLNYPNIGKLAELKMNRIKRSTARGRW